MKNVLEIEQWSRNPLSRTILVEAVLDNEPVDYAICEMEFESFVDSTLGREWVENSGLPNEQHGKMTWQEYWESDQVDLDLMGYIYTNKIKTDKLCLSELNTEQHFPAA